MRRSRLLNPYRFIFFSLLVIPLVFLNSCIPAGKTEFPSISYYESNPSDSNVSFQENPLDRLVYSGNLSVSLPVTSMTLQYLSYLFIGKNSGLFSETKTGNNGLDIPLEDLEMFRKSNLTITLKDNVPTGYTADEIRIMNLSGTLPDIFLVENIEMLKINEITPLDLSGEYLDSYLNPSKIYPQMFWDDPQSHQVLSIPYHAVVKMLYMNTNAWIGTGVNPNHFVDSPLNFNSVLTLSEYVTNPEKSIYAWLDFQSLSAFLPSSIKPFPDSYYVINQKIDFTNEAFTTTVELLRSLSSKCGVYERDENTTTESIPDDLYPINLNQIGFWIDYSNQLESLVEATQGSTLRRYPLPVVDKISIPMKTVQLVVNPQSKNVALAKKLAIFIALDKDAILFKSRYTFPNGYIPPVQDLQVWEKMVLTQYQGSELFLLRELMDASHVVYLNDHHKIVLAYDELYNELIYDILYSQVSPEGEAETLNNKIRLLLDE
jgi:hypothetical protein